MDLMHTAISEAELGVIASKLAHYRDTLLDLGFDRPDAQELVVELQSTLLDELPEDD